MYPSVYHFNVSILCPTLMSIASVSTTIIEMNDVILRTDARKKMIQI